MLSKGFSTITLLWAILTASIVVARKPTLVRRNGIEYQVLEDRDTGSTLEFVKNSGICETTPGVNTYSGYVNIGKNMSMWFWFFESRKSPSQAPLGLWLNGGPGCSSMEGVFQETGPCYFVDSNATSPVNNPYSFNEYANMLFVDEPISVGFSYGTDRANSSYTAAAYVWTFLQSWYKHFPEYENRNFSLFTESYGGHLGPTFVDYFLTQNEVVESNKTQGIEIPVVALGINDGCIDPKGQYGTYAQFAYNNTYRPLGYIINETTYHERTHNYSIDCGPALSKCAKTNATADCVAALNTCTNYENFYLDLMDTEDVNWYDVRYPLDDLGFIPPTEFVFYLAQENVTTAIGARTNFTWCSDIAADLFDDTGDGARSPVPALSRVVQAGVRTIIWTGDADWICNYLGALESANKVSYADAAAFRNASLVEYKVNGTVKGLWKGSGNLNFMRVYDAGHQLPYYQPALALQVFTQMVQGGGLHST